VAADDGFENCHCWSNVKSKRKKIGCTHCDYCAEEREKENRRKLSRRVPEDVLLARSDNYSFRGRWRRGRKET